MSTSAERRASDIIALISRPTVASESLARPPPSMRARGSLAFLVERATRAAYNSRQCRSRSPTHRSRKEPGRRKDVRPRRLPNSARVSFFVAGHARSCFRMQQASRQMTAEISQAVMHPRRPAARSRQQDFRRTTAHPLHPQPSMMGRVPVHQLAKFLPVERTPPRWSQLVNIDGGGTGGPAERVVHRHTCLALNLRNICRHQLLLVRQYTQIIKTNGVRPCHCYAANALHNLQGQRNGMLARTWPPATESARRPPDMPLSRRLAVMEATLCARRGPRKLTAAISSCLHMIPT